MDNEQRITAIFDELNRAPKREVDHYWTGEIFVGAVLIAGTLLFWPELRHLAVLLMQRMTASG